MDALKRQLYSVEDMIRELLHLIQQYEHTHSAHELDCVLDRMAASKDYLLDEIEDLSKILNNEI